MAGDPLDALRLPVVPVDPRPEFAAELHRRIEAIIEGGADPGGRPGDPTVRYFVDDLELAVAFYCRQLGFTEELRSPPAFAMLYRGGLRLLLSVPGLPGAGAALPDGAVPAAGGWNRITVQVSDLGATVAALSGSGVPVRAGIASGIAVRQALIQDPSGNLVELIEPAEGYHERT
jgi:catechol 2,3-dioxygenase-like lactoylglutathione lyase family enzyme